MHIKELQATVNFLSEQMVCSLGHLLSAKDMLLTWWSFPFFFTQREIILSITWSKTGKAFLMHIYIERKRERERKWLYFVSLFCFFISKNGMSVLSVYWKKTVLASAGLYRFCLMWWDWGFPSGGKCLSMWTCCQERECATHWWTLKCLTVAPTCLKDLPQCFSHWCAVNVAPFAGMSSQKENGFVDANHISSQRSGVFLLHLLIG